MIVTDIEGCRHIFGEFCIMRWLNNGSGSRHLCPLCRAHWFHGPEAEADILRQETEGLMDQMERLQQLRQLQQLNRMNGGPNNRGLSLLGPGGRRRGDYVETAPVSRNEFQRDLQDFTTSTGYARLSSHNPAVLLSGGEVPRPLLGNVPTSRQPTGRSRPPPTLVTPDMTQPRHIRRFQRANDARIEDPRSSELLRALTEGQSRGVDPTESRELQHLYRGTRNPRVGLSSNPGHLMQHDDAQECHIQSLQRRILELELQIEDEAFLRRSHTGLEHTQVDVFPQVEGQQVVQERQRVVELNRREAEIEQREYETRRRRNIQEQDWNSRLDGLRFWRRFLTAHNRFLREQEAIMSAQRDTLDQASNRLRARYDIVRIREAELAAREMRLQEREDSLHQREHEFNNQ